MSRNPAEQLHELGQSVWYDNISRDFITGGEIKRLVQEWGVRGMTSNPSIFDAALKEGEAYDGQIISLRNESLSTDALFDELALQDIAWAADVLLPVYRKSNGLDGFVSLEVSPLLARDADKTISDAKKLFGRLNRHNIMIKIPGTEECLPAITECLASGININVTLLFSVDSYVSVARAYCEGLRKRLAAGEDVTGVRSVASFFVSRVDAKVDAALESHGSQGKELQGKFGIANCKLAYEQFKNIFYGEEFADLREAGASVQRPLWASTSTKNPNYKDTLYVEELIGPDTVNTMPHQTLEAFVDHGIAEATLDKGYDEAHKVKQSIEDLGIDLMAILNDLQVEGVKKFEESFESLIKSVEEKAARLVTE